MWKDEVGELLSNEEVAPGFFLANFRLPGIGESILPGQFLNVLLTRRAGERGGGFANGCYQETDPLLRRPFSIYRVCGHGMHCQVLYRVVGKGTHLLSMIRPGERLRIMGPLGQGFSLTEKQNVLLISGGIGLAPLVYLSETLLARGNSVLCLAGFTSAEQINIVAPLEQLGVPVDIATEDGKAGYHGTATDLLVQTLKHRSFDRIYTCGPEPMMKGVVDIAERAGIPVELSLERSMACGVGACLGCSCQTKNAEDNPGIKHVCKDGPVFAGNEVILRG